VVGGTPTITVDESVAHQRIVTVNVAVTVPMYFMPILGFNNQTVAATGQATRRDANVMLVLDRSNSMNNSSGSCGVLVASAQNFVNQFVDGRDRLGLVTYQTGANVDYAPTLYFKSASPSLNSTLGTLACAGDTSTAQGLYLGYDQIKNTINQPGALNVILLFTDGQPNALVANFVVKSAVDNRYDSNNTSSVVSTPKSGCVASTLTGVISDASTETATDVNSLNATGYTVAVLSSAGVSISNNSNPTTINASGCAFPNSNWSYAVYGRKDVAAIPSQDAFGDSTLDRGMVPNLDVFPSGYTYVGLIRPDMPRTVRWAAFNAVDSRAQIIHNDSTYSPIIYTIGLAGNETMAMDQDFMERVANDPRATNYDSTKPQGQFILASDTSQLAQAFQQVASQILRLSK
jgi:Mg-chelatase subunit ChlD